MGVAVETLTTFEVEEEVSATTEICEKNKDWCAGKERYVHDFVSFSDVWYICSFWSLTALAFVAGFFFYFLIFCLLLFYSFYSVIAPGKGCL